MKSIMSPKSDGFLKYLLKNADNVLFRKNVETFNKCFIINLTTVLVIKKIVVLLHPLHNNH
ncbi:hypothetical protein D3C71_36550 [compost metagenome]